MKNTSSTTTTALKLTFACLLLLLGAGSQGCNETLSGLERDEWAEGTIKILEDFQPSLYVVIPDSNHSIAFALSGLPEFLPPENLPDEFKKSGLRVTFNGEIVNIPPEVRLPAVPLRLVGIKKLGR